MHIGKAPRDIVNRTKLRALRPQKGRQGGGNRRASVHVIIVIEVQVFIQDNVPILGRASVDVKRRGRGHNVRRQRRESVYRCENAGGVYIPNGIVYHEGRASRRNVVSEVRMYKRTFCGDALGRVVGQHLLKFGWYDQSQ